MLMLDIVLVLALGQVTLVSGFNVPAGALVSCNFARSSAFSGCCRQKKSGEGRLLTQDSLVCMKQQSAGTDVPTMLPEGLYRLNAEMRVAVQMEDFKKAAGLRDSIKAETARDPVACLLAQLKEAVDDQAYDKAKALKQQLAAAVKSRAKDLRSSRGKPQYRVNRLLILSTDGSLQTTDPTGSFPVTLSEPSNKGKEVFMQPCWSPGADLIVATKVQLAGERLAQSKESTVRVFWALDGSEMVDVTAPYIPFFYFWMPDSKEVVYLTTYGDAKPEAGWQVSMDMVRVMSEESSALLQGGGIMHVDEGVPLFFCPSPRDRRLLLHVGDKKQVKIIEPLSLEGQEVILSTRPGAFRCPVWLPKKGSNGEELVVFVQVGQAGSEHLILADARGGEGPNRRRKLMDCEGFTTVCVSPDGEKMAVLTRKKKALTESLTILDGPFDLEEDPWPTSPSEVGSNADPNSLAPKRRVLCYYWSPDSRYLLWLSSPEKNDILAATGGPVSIYWQVLDAKTGRTFEFEPHVPSETVLTSYVPFFDQYALSQNLWSPDSKSFCYTARGADGGLGAYVQDVPASAGQVARPRLVFSGAQTVSWSPF